MRSSELWPWHTWGLSSTSPWLHAAGDLLGVCMDGAAAGVGEWSCGLVLHGKLGRVLESPFSQDWAVWGRTVS